MDGDTREDAPNEFDAEAFIDYQYGDQMNARDLPLVPLSVMRLATDNFADANKLGQGGFGQVYKVRLSNTLSGFSVQG